MKQPSADHPITVSPVGGTLEVQFHGTTIARTSRALTLKEAHYPPVYYLPRADIVARHFQRTAHSSYCPYKGQASYFSLVAGDQVSENAVWSYEKPYPAVAGIEGYVAFYPDRVTFTTTP
ncbi:DUF427 domain-containing protein [Pseudomonas sp. App30]|uniref:DUF427 domain-containing protein n=1 Tax=Pseudomonas sp. App30 TaxID=3068990 RepID=UPI003A802665